MKRKRDRRDTPKLHVARDTGTHTITEVLRAKKNGLQPQSANNDPSNARDERAFAAAVAWVRHHSSAGDGSEFAGFRLDDTQSGALAKHDLAQGDCVLRIPLRLTVTGHTARSTKIGSIAARVVASCAPVGLDHEDLVMAFHLAAEALPFANKTDGPSVASVPFHAPFYATLPVGAHDPRHMMPRCWSDAELDAHLRGSPSAAVARRTRDAVRTAYEAITRAAGSMGSSGTSSKPAGWPSFEAFDWGLAMVSSRAFAVATGSGGHVEHALVPLADMLNHTRPREVSYDLASDGQSLELRLLQPMAAGGEMHITYGALGSAQLLANFGFSLLHNVEPDGSGNDVRDLPLPHTKPSQASLVYTPPTVAPLRVGPKRYSLGPLTKAVDAFRVAAFAHWEQGNSGANAAGAKRLQGVALESRALKRLVRAINVELDGYGMDDAMAEAAASRAPAWPITTPPTSAATLLVDEGANGGLVDANSDRQVRCAKAAAALVLNERNILQFYHLIASLCLQVLTVDPEARKSSDGGGHRGGVPVPQSATQCRRAAAKRLGDTVKLAQEPASQASSGGVMAVLQRHAGHDVAAPVALAFLQIRFPALF